MNHSGFLKNIFYTDTELDWGNITSIPIGIPSKRVVWKTKNPKLLDAGSSVPLRFEYIIIESIIGIVNYPSYYLR